MTISKPKSIRTGSKGRNGIILASMVELKGQGHVTVNKPVISRIYIVAIVFCTDFGGWCESIIKLLRKIHQYLCNRTTYECFGCFSTKYKNPSSK